MLGDKNHSKEQESWHSVCTTSEGTGNDQQNSGDQSEMKNGGSSSSSVQEIDNNGDNNNGQMVIDLTTTPPFRTGRILKVVLTGGPVAGKTSAIKLLTSLLATEPTLQNPKVLAIPETATMLYEMGISRKDELGRGKTRQLLAFQQALFEIQISLENTAMKLARKSAH